MYSVTMEVVRLKELCPELLVGQFVGDVVHVLLLDSGVGLEDGLYDVGGEVVLETVGSISLGFDLC